MTLKQFKAKCNNKNKAFWEEVTSVIELGAHIGEDLINDVAERASHTDGSEAAYDEIITERCLTNVVLIDVKQFTFATVSQCLTSKENPNEAKRSVILKDAMIKTCLPIKEM